MAAMTLKGGAIAALILVAITAGCVGTESAKPAAASTVAPAPAAVANESAGSIAGLVVDDEQVPLAGATVAVVQTGATAETDPAGRFTFNGLPTGTYSLVASLLGFEEGAKKVDVAAGAVAEVRFVLRQMEIPDEPYHTTILKVAQMHVNWVYLTHAFWGQGINQSAYNQLVCDPCRFTLFFTPKPQDALTEAFFKAGVMNQAVNNQVYLWYAKNATENYGEQVYTGYIKHRGVYHWTEPQVAAVKNVDKINLWVQGDLLSVNYELRAEIYTSLAYVAPLPEGFTSLPPP